MVRGGRGIIYRTKWTELDFFFNIFRAKSDWPEPIPRDLSIGPPDRFGPGGNEVLRGIKRQESNTEIFR